MRAINRLKWGLSIAGGLVVIYCVIILGFVSTSPDIRLRFLIADNTLPSEAPSGIEIQAAPGAKWKGPRPKAGDVLVRIGERRIRNFLDFTGKLVELRNAPTPGGQPLYAGSDPSEFGSLPPLVEIEGAGRFVRIEFWREGWGEPRVTWLQVQSLPLGEVVLSLIWFVLQLSIFVVTALAFWNRPFDRPARLFFAMCVVTLGAFVGGYHWWVIGGSLWLSAPFIVCSMLLPAVLLHFFLIYPHAKPVMAWWPRGTAVGLYVLPILSMIGLLSLRGYCGWLNSNASTEADFGQVLYYLQILRQMIYLYVTVSAVYFLLTLVVLRYSLSTTRNAIEQSQVQWILWAGRIATVFVGITLYLAYFDRVAFALGAARIPMFLASLSFMLAYAVGIVRYKLMLVDQIISRGVLYYVVGYGVALGFSIIIVLSSLVTSYLNIHPSPQQAISVFAILMVAVVLLLWLRDRFQQVLDRRFFREKYQLDKALQRVNRAVGHLVDPELLADRMLASCRDALRVDRSALYLRGASKGVFRLVAADRSENIPLQFTADKAFLDALKQDNSLQRITPGTRSGMSPVQQTLRTLKAGLVHALEADGEITGLVVLGVRSNGAAYTGEDITFLNAMGQITSVALHCAKVHQDLTRLNEELRLKVEKIDDQKRQIAMLQAELTSTQPSPNFPVPETFRRDGIKGNSPPIRRVLETVRKVANSESSVLIRGESGTGKELLAQSIHDNSPRHSGPMIRVHCAALSPTLLESELFGHAKGAFTGAHRDKMGRFEMANGGTLFLDEIGDISLETQIKLLRVLQERNFEPVGGTRTVHVDVRVIAATHQNLERLIAEGKFREDLYYRLNVISITLPPLRERKEDIFELALHFLKRAAGGVGKRITHLDEEAVDALERYNWPGNIRELENVIERAVVLAENEQISLQDLSGEIVHFEPALPDSVIETQRVPQLARSTSAEVAELELDGGTTRRAFENRSEREILEQALEKCSGNKAQAARTLGMPRSTFYSKLKKHSIG